MEWDWKAEADSINKSLLQKIMSMRDSDTGVIWVSPTISRRIPTEESMELKYFTGGRVLLKKLTFTSPTQTTLFDNDETYVREFSELSIKNIYMANGKVYIPLLLWN